MDERLLYKLEILSDAAKYDVSCAASGSDRPGTRAGLGTAGHSGICHSFTEDGRCITLLKLLFTNHCIYDCAYCVSRRSSDVARVAFTVKEVVDLTLSFYRRNYIDGLFLSSGIFKNADYTTERLVRVAKELRTLHQFHGYIHLKVIPGCSPELLDEAALYADRLSVNLEIATEQNLKKVAPEKDFASAFRPMAHLRDNISAHREARQQSKRAPLYAPGGQSTQLVVGATPETDKTVLYLASDLYKKQRLRRVYYSGFIPVSEDPRLLKVDRTPLVREHRLYQADWLLRYYGFEAHEIVDDHHEHLDLHVDPKVAYALRRPEAFPVDVNRDAYEWIVRVPGIGVRSARRIVAARRHGTLRWEHLQKMGVVLKRARFFIKVPQHTPRDLEKDPWRVYNALRKPIEVVQPSLFS